MKFSFKKQSPMGLTSLPNPPKNSQPGLTNTDFTPLKKVKHGFNKKIVVGLGVVLSLIIVGLTAYIATRSQPQTTKTHAAGATGCIPITIGQDTIDACPDSVSLSADKLSATAVFHIAISGSPSTTSSISVPVKETTFWCAIDSSACQDGPSSKDQTYTLDSTNTSQIISMTRTSDNAQPCGSYRFDIDISSQNLSQTVATGTDCTTGVSPSPTETPTPIPSGSTLPPPPTATPTGAKTYSLSGVVYSSSTTPTTLANSCVPSGTGLNGVNVSLSLNGTVVQKDTTHTPPDVDVPGTFAFSNLDAGTYSLCLTVPTGSQISCPASINATASNCFSEVVPSTNTSPLAFNLTTISSPSATPTGTPSPTNSVGGAPTPTNKVVVITATPTPTTIIVVGATNTPGPTTASQSTPAASPSIPSAGNPLPYVAVAIPFVLILIAFIL